MGNAKANKPPNERDLRKLFDLLGRGYAQLSEPMKSTARDILFKQIEYDPTKPPTRILSELIQMYAYEMYGKGSVSKGNENPDQLLKGSMAEPEAIKLLSRADGIDYVKNEELFSNKWLKGIPDIIIRSANGKVEKIIEVKTSYDLPSFIMALNRQEFSSNIFETMGYMDMLGCKNAEIVHCLVDMPEKIVSFKEKKMKERHLWLEIDEETSNGRIESVLNDMEYSDIPEELKIFRRPVTLNKLTMKDVKRRVTLSKKWIKDVHDLFTKNTVILPEIEQDKTDDSI